MQQLDPTREFSILQFNLLAQSDPGAACDAYHHLLDRYHRLCINLKNALGVQEDAYQHVSRLERELSLVKTDRLDQDREIYEMRAKIDELRRANKLLLIRLQGGGNGN